MVDILPGDMDEDGAGGGKTLADAEPPPWILDRPHSAVAQSQNEEENSEKRSLYQFLLYAKPKKRESE